MIRWLSRVADSSQYQALQRVGKRSRRKGHVPVHVGEEMERFEVRTELLSRPAFVELLRLSAHEYGYEQRGVLRIPCPVPLFRHLLAGGGAWKEDSEELLRSLDEIFLSSSHPS